MATAIYAAMDLSVGKSESLLIKAGGGGAVDLTLRSSEMRSPRLLTVSPIDSSSSSSSISPQESVSTSLSSLTAAAKLDASADDGSFSSTLQSLPPVLCLPRSGGLPTMVQYVAAAAAQFSALQGIKSLSHRGSPKHQQQNTVSTKKVRSSTSSTDFTRVSSLLPNQMRASQRQGQKKSAVWQWFHHPQRQNGFVDEHHTKCKLCETELAFNSSGTTTTMLNHLKSRHENQVNIEREMAQARASRMQKKSNGIKCKNMYNPCGGVSSSAPSENHNPSSGVSKDSFVGQKTHQKAESAMPPTPCLEKQQLDNTSSIFHQHFTSNGTKMSASTPLASTLHQQQFSNKRNHLYVATEFPSLTAATQASTTTQSSSTFADGEPLTKRPRKRKTTPKQILPPVESDEQLLHQELKAETTVDSEEKNGQQQNFLQAFTSFLSKDLYPANIIQQEGMQSLLKALGPKCALPCVSEVIEHLEKRATVSRCRLSSRLSSDCLMLAASVEVWNKRSEIETSLPMATVTIHFFDEQFQGPLSVNLKTEPCHSSLMKKVMVCCETLDLKEENELILVTNEYFRCKTEMLELGNHMTGPHIVLLPCFMSVLDSIFLALMKQPCMHTMHVTLNCHTSPDQSTVEKWHKLRALMGGQTRTELQLIELLESVENLALDALSCRLPLSAALRCLRTQVFAVNKEDEEAVAVFKLTACNALNELYALEGRGAQILTAAESLCQPEPSSQTLLILCTELLRHGVHVDDANEQVTSFLAKISSNEEKLPLNASWWSEQSTNWPNLSHLARCLLPLPVSCRRLPLHMESRRAHLISCSNTPTHLDAVDATLALHEHVSLSC